MRQILFIRPVILLLILFGLPVLPALLWHINENNIAFYAFQVGSFIFWIIWLKEVGRAANHYSGIHKQDVYVFESCFYYLLGIMLLSFIAFTPLKPYINRAGPIIGGFALPSILYMTYFSARMLNTAELKRKVRFYDYGNAFWFLLFFPIGIFYIQPRIISILERNNAR
jgi:hypothetical protein